MTLATAARTARARAQVDVGLNGTRIASVFFDADGRVEDVTTDRADSAATARGIVKAAQHPLTAKYFGTPLIKGERYGVSFDPRDVLDDSFARDFPTMHREVTVQYEIVAFRTMLSRRVVEMRCVIPNLLRSSATITRGSNGQMIVDSVSGTESSYVDIADGFSVAGYQIMEITGRMQGKAIVFRVVTSMNLDPSKSKGLQSATQPE